MPSGPHVMAQIRFAIAAAALLLIPDLKRR